MRPEMEVEKGAPRKGRQGTARARQSRCRQRCPRKGQWDQEGESGWKKGLNGQQGQLPKGIEKEMKADTKEMFKNDNRRKVGTEL